MTFMGAIYFQSRSKHYQEGKTSEDFSPPEKERELVLPEEPDPNEINPPEEEDN